MWRCKGPLRVTRLVFGNKTPQTQIHFQACPCEVLAPCTSIFQKAVTPTSWLKSFGAVSAPTPCMKTNHFSPEGCTSSTCSLPFTSHRNRVRLCCRHSWTLRLPSQVFGNVHQLTAKPFANWLPLSNSVMSGLWLGMDSLLEFLEGQLEKSWL